MVTVRAASRDDTAVWLEMRRDLWPDDAAEEHRAEIERYFSGAAPTIHMVLVAVDADDAPAGFAELSLRPYAEGCTTSPVAYLEGWYVTPMARGAGVGGALIAAAEEWGRSRGCSEFASDTEVDNDVSARAHLALGFEDVGFVRCFRKPL
ncbi:MAG TPA: aminoglycoside 6'-N-acetyltransferase [Acidimicrobiia bacterium]|nr:aminoglycoside 6'-N-acetyltransferase [Acidimicrobiia bacterium]